jgi:hypothetical protein
MPLEASANIGRMIGVDATRTSVTVMAGRRYGGSAPPSLT